MEFEKYLSLCFEIISQKLKSAFQIEKKEFINKIVFKINTFS